MCLSKEEKDNVSNVRIGLINRDKDGIIELFIKNPTYVEKTSKDKKKYNQLASGDIFFKIVTKGTARPKKSKA